MDAAKLWYSVVNGRNLDPVDQLEQGDILRDYQLARVEEVLKPEANETTVKVKVLKTDIVVLTQSCDIPKISQQSILVAELNTYDHLAEMNSDVRGDKWRKKLIEGLITGLFLLHENPERPEFPWSIASFRDLHVLQKSDVLNFAASDHDRLRLNSPYKEYLSQGYARFMMRVGLPAGATLFERYKPSPARLQGPNSAAAASA